MKAILRHGAILFLSAILLAVGGQTAFAQTEGLQIKPALVTDKANVGDSFTFTINITNIAGTPKTFYLSAQDIKGVEGNGVPIFAAEGEKTGYELSSWINLSSGSITLNAGETRAIPFSVKVPATASPGSHFAGIFLTDKPPQRDTSGSAISIRVGSIVSIRIAGDVHDEARIREFSTGKVVYPSANVDFNARLENLGNLLVRPQGIIEISNMFGKKVASVEINSDAAAVFPTAYRIFSAQWKSDSLAFGRYQAVVSFVYGEDARKTISETTSFWVLPVGLIVTVLLSIFGTILVFYMGIKMYIRNKLKQMGVAGGKRADTDYYAQKYQRSGSRLVFIVVALFIACLLLLGILFAIFA